MKNIKKFRRFLLFSNNKIIYSLFNLTKRQNNKGAALIGIIITLIIISVLGTGVFYLTSTSQYSEVFVNQRERAYYLAQSGIQYARPIILAANGAGQTAPITALNGQTFTLANNGGAFYLSTAIVDNAPPNPSYTVVESTGILNPNTFQEVRQKIMVKITKAGGYESGDDFHDPTEEAFNQNWNIIGGGSIKDISEDGVKVQGKISVIAMDPDGPNNPDYSLMRSNNDNLLSYKLQAKFAIGVYGRNGTTYMSGLNFRLTTTESIISSTYGISFYKHTFGDLTDWQLWYMDSSWDVFRFLGATKIYLVLWEKTSSSSQYHVLAYKRLTNAEYPDIIGADGELIDYSTIAVDLVEEYIGTGPNRINKITAYINGAANYPHGTISNDFSAYNFRKVVWDSYPTGDDDMGISSWQASHAYAFGNKVFPASANGHYYVCISAGTSGGSQPAWPTANNATVTDGTVVWQESTTIINDDLTTENYSERSEVGTHIYYNQPSGNKLIVDDLSLVQTLSGSGVIGGGTAY